MTQLNATEMQMVVGGEMGPWDTCAFAIGFGAAIANFAGAGIGLIWCLTTS